MALEHKDPIWAALISLISATMACGDAGPTEEATCDEGVVLAAELVLEQNCHQCHGQNGTANGNMNFIMDAEQLVAHGLVIPDDPASSPLYARMALDTMPPVGVSARPDAAALESVRKWIECGAPSFAEAVSSREFVSTAEVLRLLREDLELQDPANQKYTRYLSLVNLHNDPSISEDSLSTYRHGLNKQVNDVSRGSKVVLPQSIDDRQILYRIDLRDYLWEVETNGEDRWDLMARQYPYGVHDPDLADTTYLNDHTESLMPVINADWFVFAASEPPLYYDMLRLPATIAELIQYLGVAVDGKVATAGVVNSGVSTSNRIVRRHNSQFGALWESSDFASSVGDKNILENPLPLSSGFQEFAHVPDGGEYIFTLPNGLHGYLITNASGVVLAEAPAEIVFDPNDPFNPIVRSGRKCSKCHVEGINPVEDRVRGYVESNPNAFTPEVVDQVVAEYPTVEEFAELVAQDQDAFLAARALTGIPANVEGNDSVPISFLADAFQGSIDIDRAAANFGLPVDSLRTEIESSDELRASLGPLLVDGGVLKRETFRDAFPAAVCAMNLGQPLINGIIVPCSCPCDPNPNFNNFCSYLPNTAGCPMTAAGGYCDPNGDGSFVDADVNRGLADYQALCGL